MGAPARDLPGRLDETVAAGRAAGLHALVVVRHGRQQLEWYGTGADVAWGRPLGTVAFGPHTLHDLRSVTKSVVGLLYGIALAAGAVPGPGEPLLRQFPEYPDLAGDRRRAALTVGHALTMTLGLEWNEDLPYDTPANSEIAMELAPDRVRYVLERPVVEQPGERWRYCGGATALLGRLITAGTGRPLPEFARDALFGPLGIGAYEWSAGADGVASAASGLRLTPRDLARIGQLVLDGGAWQDHRVVPAGWLGAMLRKRVRIGDGLHYGYQWYLGGAARSRWVGGMGNGGQRLVVFPDLGLVVAIAAGLYDSPGQATLPPTLLEEVILPAVTA